MGKVTVFRISIQSADVVKKLAAGSRDFVRHEAKGCAILRLMYI